MQSIEEGKTEQINNIVSTIKLTVLLFCGIICFRYLFNDNESLKGIQQETIGFCVISTFILLGVYYMWTFWTKKTSPCESLKYKQIIENIVFIILFLFMIMISGTYMSNYKFLFLFLVTANTIQSGLKHGMAIACLSSVGILMIDLICYPNEVVNHHFENDLILAGIFILTAWPLGYYVRVEQEYIKELTKRANCDGLTGVYNHRFFHDKVAEKLAFAKENNETLSILFMDIDNFKYYNDLNGHQKGDEVLRIIGRLLKEEIGEAGVVARYGGEEFGIILPNVDQNRVEVAEHIRKLVENTYIIGQENQPAGNLTVSVGIATYPHNATNDIELIKSADDALFRAKFFNKNRVEAYSSILEDLIANVDEEKQNRVNSIQTLISVINAKDKYTYGHSERVVLYSKILAEKLSLSEEDTKELIYSAYMHDIGKISIPETILNKSGRLTDEEFEIIKEHPRQSVELMSTMDVAGEVASIIMSHHERYDGKGYPRGLKGEEIPVLARALNIVDSFDAMTSNKPYSQKKDYNAAFSELRKCSGTQFDPEIVERFIEAVIENKEELKKIN